MLWKILMVPVVAVGFVLAFAVTAILLDLIVIIVALVAEQLFKL